ncbi:MAG: hypothetical protein ACPL3A_05725 [Thermoanaerobacteraceae bacterium]
MGNDKYIKGFLAGIAASIYMLPKINTKKNKTMIQRSLARLIKVVNKI